MMSVMQVNFIDREQLCLFRITNVNGSILIASIIT